MAEKAWGMGREIAGNSASRFRKQRGMKADAQQDSSLVSFFTMGLEPME